MSNQLCKSCKPDRQKIKFRDFFNCVLSYKREKTTHRPTEKLSYSGEVLNNIL